LLITRPDVLIEANDVAICLRSAGGRTFNREREALGIGDVDRIFAYSIDSAPNIYARSYVKYSRELKKEFNDNNAMNPEISCIVDNQRLSLDHTERIVVDRYVIEGEPLRNYVIKLTRDNLRRLIIERHPYREERITIKNDILTTFRNEIPLLINLAENQLFRSYTRDWANRIRTCGLEWQYRRYAKYLREGTLLPIVERIA